MAKNIFYLIVIIAAFFIILFNTQINMVVKIICLLTMATGAIVMIQAIIREHQNKKQSE